MEGEVERGLWLMLLMQWIGSLAPGTKEALTVSVWPLVLFLRHLLSG